LQSEPPGVAGRPNAPDRPALRRATAGRKSSLLFWGFLCLPLRDQTNSLTPGFVFWVDCPILVYKKWNAVTGLLSTLLIIGLTDCKSQSEPPGVAGRPNAPDRPALRRATAGRKSSFF